MNVAESQCFDVRCRVAPVIISNCCIFARIFNVKGLTEVVRNYVSRTFVNQEWLVHSKNYSTLCSVEYWML